MQKTLLSTAQDQLLLPGDLDPQHLESLLNGAMSRQADYGDVYMQYAQSETWVLDDGIVKEGHYHVDAGFGLRIISGEKTGFAYADEISSDAIVQAAKSANAIVRDGGSERILTLSDRPTLSLYGAVNPLDSLPDNEKVLLLKSLDHTARSQDPRVKQVMLRLSGSYSVVLILNSMGQWVADVRPLVTLWMRVIAENKTRKEQGSSGMGGRYDYKKMLGVLDQKQFVARAVNQALTNLEAVPTPAGAMPVVLGAGWPGILLHEAVGHGLEGDFNRKGSSAFSGRIGERVATDVCTVVDDGTIEERRGSLNMDDEGVAAQNTVLIENGILKGYMQDRHNAQLMNVASTGNGRRESYAHRPLPRMTNTYMLPGAHDPKEIIQSVKKGIYAVDFSGGQVDITSGKFVFSMSEAYLIENGKITRPVTGATLIGDGPSVMQRISMVGHDLALDTGIGTCGKNGQSVPVGVGQPTLKIDEVIVGGAG
jgi:TldD protein